MDDCSCSNCLRKIFQTVKMSQRINFPRTFKTDYQEQYNSKLQPDQLKFKINDYKPLDKFLLLESQYKTSFRNLKGQKEQLIKQNLNLKIPDYAQLENSSTYKRSFRSNTLHEKTQPIVPVNVINKTNIPMLGNKSIYQLNYTQQKLQKTEKIYQYSQRIMNQSWNKDELSQYRQTFRGQKGERSLKSEPLSNQIFILNYQKKPSSQYQQEHRNKELQCKKLIY